MILRQILSDFYWFHVALLSADNCTVLLWSTTVNWQLWRAKPAVVWCHKTQPPSATRSGYGETAVEVLATVGGQTSVRWLWICFIKRNSVSQLQWQSVDWSSQTVIRLIKPAPGCSIHHPPRSARRSGRSGLCRFSWRMEIGCALA